MTKTTLRMRYADEMVVPVGAEIVGVGVVDGCVYVWIMFDPKEKFVVTKYFRLVRDDVCVDKFAKYHGLAHDGKLIRHLFEIR